MSRKLNIIRNRTVFFAISGILVLASIFSLSVWGLNLGIDFTGGTLLEVEYNTDYMSGTQEIKTKLEGEGFLVSSVQPTGEKGIVIRMNDMPEEEHQRVLGVLREEAREHKNTKTQKHKNTKTQDDNDETPAGEQLPVQGGSALGGNNGEETNNETTIQENQLNDSQPLIVENRFESVGPVIGKELRERAVVAIIVALVVIVLYIAWAFRKVSRPVASWKYGLGAIVALAHDILIVTGVFAVLGHVAGVEVGILFVTALLTVLGYSVNDTIVVYDRTRENLIYNPEDTFEDTVNKSLNQTISRSINTSLTTLLVLLALYFLGGTSIKEFVLVLIMGALVGTYSSIFVASPLLVVWQKLSRRR